MRKVTVVCMALGVCGCGGKKPANLDPKPATPNQQSATYILDVEEYDANRNKTDLNHDGTPLVDIYSTLDLKIDREALAARALKGSRGNASDSMLVRLKALLDIAQQGANAMLSLTREFEQAQGTGRSPSLLVPLQEEAATVTVGALKSARQYPDLIAAINAGVSGNLSSLEQMQVIFDSTASFAKRMSSARIDSLVAVDRVFVQIEAILVSAAGSRQVHMEGFDSVKSGPAYDPPRFGVNLSEAQMAELKAYSDAAKAIRTGAYGTALQDLLKLPGPAIAKAAADAQTCLARVVTDAKVAQLSSAPDAFVQARTLVEGFGASMKTLVAKYTGTGPGAGDDLTLLAQSVTDLYAVVGETADMGAALTSLETASVAAATGAMLAAATQVATDALACAKTIESAGSPLKELAAQLHTAGAPARIAADVDTIASKALRFDVNAVPTTTQISLRTDVGQRAAGDQIVIRVRSGNGTGAANRELELRRFVIGHAVTYLQTTTGLIFARPMRTIPPPANSTQEVSPFFPAAAYSVLLKPISGRLARKSGWYADVFDPGVGINMSALDFNHDNTPELGVSGVLSILRDYVQAGVGYNIQQAKSFWFIGIRLPAAGQSLSLPGGGP
jgi:hypothetical protein